MVKFVDKCNGCADGCHGCGLDSVKVKICDRCGEENAEFTDGTEDFCEDCLMQVLDDILTNDLDIYDKIKAIKYTTGQPFWEV